MSATCDYYLECIDNDCLPLSDETWDYLECIHYNYHPVLIETSEFKFTSRFGETWTVEGITVNCARRLERLGLAVTEIKDFLELTDDCLAGGKGVL